MIFFQWMMMNYIPKPLRPMTRLSAVTIFFCDLPSKWGRIIHQPSQSRALRCHVICGCLADNSRPSLIVAFNGVVAKRQTDRQTYGATDGARDAVVLLGGRVARCGRQIGCDPLTVIRFTPSLPPQHLLYTFSLNRSLL